MRVERAKLARRLGLPEGASESMVKARLKGLEVQEQLRAASTAGSGRRQPAAVEHEAFISQFFPALADKLGYAAPYVGGFLMASATRSAESPVSASSTPARAATVEDEAHRDTMARFFPAVGKGPFVSRRATIRRYGA